LSASTVDGEPAISVVIPAYESRLRIGPALQGLQEQDVAEPFEVIVAASGGDGLAEHLGAAHPKVRVIDSEVRLLPGAARNRGWAAARAPFVAFLADDCVPEAGWLRLRLARHRDGFDAVGGAIANGTPRSPVGSAGHYLEYSALLPSPRLLAEQVVPHALSYRRSLLEQLGGFPEDIRTGEDTILNKRLLAAGASVGFEPRAVFAHRNPTRLRDFLAHQHQHGRGLVRVIREHGLKSPIGRLDGPAAGAWWRGLAVYPAARWWQALSRVARGAPGRLPAYVLLSPLIWLGLWATGAGALSARRAASPSHAS